MSGSGVSEISADVIAALKSEAQTAHPAECCGLLLGTNDGTSSQITAVQPAKNVHPAPHTHFEIDPQALIDAHRKARAGGPEVLGYYHSHPNGLAEPSATDRAQAGGDNRIWAIIANDDVTFWRDAKQDGKEAFISLPYTITKP